MTLFHMTKILLKNDSLSHKPFGLIYNYLKVC